MARIAGLATVLSADVTISDDVVITDALTVSGASTLNGNLVLGNATTDTIGFYGTTPTAQLASASQAVVTPTAVTAIVTTVLSQANTGMWAFSSSTIAQTWRTRINQAVVDIAALGVLTNQLRAELVALGLIKGAA